LDLTGQRFGRFVVLARAPDRKRNVYWKCKCDCGEFKTVCQGSLRSGKSKSCRCYQRSRIREIHRVNIPIGTRFGKLVVLGIAESKYGKTHWSCQCDCGNIKNVESNHLRYGDTKSCGCYQKEQLWLPKGVAAFNRLYQSYCHTAKNRGYAFSLSEKAFKLITKQRCYYCGTKPTQIRRVKSCNGDYVHNGIDRTDNSKGYVPGNIVACCRQCNFMKNNYSQKDFLAHVERIHKHQLNLSRGEVR